MATDLPWNGHVACALDTGRPNPDDAEYQYAALYGENGCKWGDKCYHQGDTEREESPTDEEFKNIIKAVREATSAGVFIKGVKFICTFTDKEAGICGYRKGTKNVGVHVGQQYASIVISENSIQQCVKNCEKIKEYMETKCNYK